MKPPFHLLLGALLLLASAADAADPLQQAQDLLAAGQQPEAFLIYLDISGAEHAAAAIGRQDPAKFRKLLQDHAGLPPARRKLLEGELLLAEGRKEEALKSFRSAAAEQTQMAYFVEPPAATTAGDVDQWNAGSAVSQRLPLAPFRLGPGSHRDNWLLRRLIGLKAWEDAAAEFARIWEMHRQRSQPYVCVVQLRHRDGVFREETRLARPVGFNGRALQFALDYAFFFRQRGDTEAAINLLLEPLLLLDMDRNPNMPRLEPISQDAAAAYPTLALDRSLSSWERGGRIGRREYIRLAFGEWKSAGQLDRLIEILEQQISAGENRLRRLLAIIQLHRGEGETALELEMAYIEAAKFNDLSEAYRRGRVHEDHQRLKEAAADFEKVLELPEGPADLPDAEEEQLQSSFVSAVLPAKYSGLLLEADIQGDALERLQRIYSALGESGKATASAMRRFERNLQLFDQLGDLEQLALQVRSTGQDEKVFRAWLREQSAEPVSQPARANIFWLLGDHAATADALAAAAKESEHRIPLLQPWKERFRQAGPDKLRLLLKKVLEVSPQDALTRWELLYLEQDPREEEVIAALEALLDAEAQPLFTLGKSSPRNLTEFTDYFDLGYRLMRLYEKQERLEKLGALGLRIARGEKPFVYPDLEQHRYRGSNQAPEHANACLALAIQHAADPSSQAALAEALQDSPWIGAKAQIARRQAGEQLRRQATPNVPWAHLEAQALASGKSVFTLLHDERYVYAGQPWGVAVYDLLGQPVTRIPLGDGVYDMARLGEALWVATEQGLFRIALDGWQTALMPRPLHPAERPPSAGQAELLQRVQCVVSDGQKIWFGSSKDIRSFDPATDELRIYNQEELGGIDDWTDLVMDGRYVWAQGYGGLVRFDRETEEWKTVQYGRTPVYLTGIGADRIWGRVNMGEPLWDRPCRIDRTTLEVSPVLIDPQFPAGNSMINGPFLPDAYLPNGELMFTAGGSEYFALHEASMLLRKLPERPEEMRRLQILRGSRELGHSNDPIFNVDEFWPAEVPHDLGDPDAPHRSALVLPNGTLVLGQIGGLSFKPAGAAAARTVDVGLPGDEVFDVYSQEKQGLTWVCTSGGLAMLDRELRQVATFTTAEGLIHDRVTGVAVLNGLLYFSSGWGDSGGGLIVYDPATSVFTSFTQSDGLDADKLEGIRVKNGKLEITYAIEYLRHSSDETQRYRRFPPSLFDPARRTFTSGGAAQFMTQNEAEPRRNRDVEEPALPVLGGAVYQQLVLAGKKWICGSRGLVQTDARVVPGFAVVSATRSLDARQQQLADALARPAEFSTLEELLRALDDENLFYRTRALSSPLAAKQKEELLPQILEQLEQSNMRLRATAMVHLTKLDPVSHNQEIIAALQKRLKDSELQIRAAATMELLRRGNLPPIQQLKETLAAAGGLGNFPYGLTSNSSGNASTGSLYKAVAPHATSGVFELLLEHPPRAGDYDYKESVFPALGGALLRQPEVAGLLLKAYDGVRHSHERRDFAQEVFRAAGTRMLPLLHEALQNQDRVIRSNAARACGAIGDVASVRPLIQSLDLESGLSRASIVWALGELQSAEALPELAKLYVDARNDEQRRSGSGFLVAQSGIVMEAQYESIRDLNVLKDEWAELEALARPRPRNPRRDEALLTPRDILRAMMKIGPEAAQEFYRALAGERFSEGRREAAIALAEGSSEDWEINLPILRNLAADGDLQVRISATVSLLMLDEQQVQGTLLDWLSQQRSQEQGQVLQQLDRLRDVAHLDFARDQLQKIAGDNSLHHSLRSTANKLLSK